MGLLAGNGRIDPDRVRWISAAGLTWLATVFYLLLTLLVLGVLALSACGGEEATPAESESSVSSTTQESSAPAEESSAPADESSAE